MVEAQEQAKQLDSVTDNVQETEVDETKAQEAMGALSAGKAADASSKAAAGHHAVENKSILLPQDVDLICNELDVTEETAKRALREAAMELAAKDNNNGQASAESSLVVKALKKLVTS